MWYECVYSEILISKLSKNIGNIFSPVKNHISKKFLWALNPLKKKKKKTTKSNIQ